MGTGGTTSVGVVVAAAVAAAAAAFTETAGRFPTLHRPCAVVTDGIFLRPGSGEVVARELGSDDRCCRPVSTGDLVPTWGTVSRFGPAPVCLGVWGPGEEITAGSAPRGETRTVIVPGIYAAP
mmetsp:Transcript_86895/g.172505  ORF Transcript_86895/g.172505 Transcript_86895/m.172505 type:complete len:123 (-) Transcript_86895:18-386(-)